MKLILAVVHHDDATGLARGLTQGGFSSTQLATTGGFLLSGNVTILIGVDEEKVQAVIGIIREHSHSRRQAVPAAVADWYPAWPVEVTVGGATIFVVDVERFERV